MSDERHAADGVDGEGLRLPDGSTSRTGGSGAGSRDPRTGRSSRRPRSRVRSSTASATRTCSPPSTTAASSACRFASSTRSGSAGRSTGRTRGAPASSTRRSSAPSPATSASSRVRSPQGTADPRPLHLVGRDDTDTSVGAGVFRRRRPDVGDELGDGLHPGGGRRGVTLLERDGTGVRTEFLHAEKVARAGRASRSRRAQVVRDRAARRGHRARGLRPRAARALRRGASRRAPARRVAGVRDPPSLRRVLLLPPPLHLAERNQLWETVWAKDGDGDPDFHPWPLDGPHRPTFGLGARRGRARAGGVDRFLRTTRDRDARLDYLRDIFEGLV